MSLPACPVCSYPIFGFVRRSASLCAGFRNKLDSEPLTAYPIRLNYFSLRTLQLHILRKELIRSQVYLSRYPQRVTAKYELRLRSGE
jgi:hypothetical protein